LPPPVTLNPNLTICRGESITLVATANTNADASFAWTESGSSTIISSDPFFSPAPELNTTYQLTVQYPDCEPQTFTVPVRVIQEPTLTVSPGASVCPGETVILSASTNAPDDVSEFFQWTVNGQTFQGPELSFSPLAPTNVSLVYTYGNNCGAITENIPINVFDVPFIDELVINPESATGEGVPLGESIGIRAVTTPTSPADVTYTWSKNGVDFASNVTEVEDTPTESPTVYRLTITTAEGCTVTKEISVNVVAPRYEVPNAFTPNGDDVNDFFNLVFVGAISISEFRIYNRWGQLVYNNDTPDTGWDGNISGNPAPSDVYIFQIGILFPDGQLFTEQGEVTLIR
ncbi:MAG: gliding motility-associated C-terminal domain-containing protein, partial [Saprospiraceae bacterium]|nr:gliding motility-associated C-terminal domain-containing protein [Saprospiraceae bacterium]